MHQDSGIEYTAAFVWYNKDAGHISGVHIAPRRRLHEMSFHFKEINHKSGKKSDT